MRRNYYITVGITESGVEKLKDNHDAEGEDIFSKTASEEEFNEIMELHFDIYEKFGVYIDEYENAKIPHSIVDDIMKQIKKSKNTVPLLWKALQYSQESKGDIYLDF